MLKFIIKIFLTISIKINNFAHIECNSLYFNITLLNLQMTKKKFFLSIYFFICFFPFLFYFCCTSTHFLCEFFRLLCGIRFNIKRHRSFAKKTWFFRRSWCFAAVALILTSDFLRSFFVQTLDAGLRFEKFADFISAMNAQETDVNPEQSFLITKLTNSNDKNDSKESQK